MAALVKDVLGVRPRRVDPVIPDIAFWKATGAAWLQTADERLAPRTRLGKRKRGRK